MTDAGTKLSKDAARRAVLEDFKTTSPIIKEVGHAREEWTKALSVVSEHLRVGQTVQGFRLAAEVGRSFRHRFEGPGQELEQIKPPSKGCEHCHTFLRTWIEWQVRANQTLAHIAQESDATKLSDCRTELEKARLAAVAFSKQKDNLFQQYGITIKPKGH